MRAVLDIVIIVLDIYWWIIIASVVLSWLLAFNVVNYQSQVVRSIHEFLYRATEPALKPIRNILPNLGPIDLSPFVLLLIIIFLKQIIFRYIYPNVF
jgi:YggT family protein